MSDTTEQGQPDPALLSGDVGGRAVTHQRLLPEDRLMKDDYQASAI